jgi:hypothetical protein
LISQWVLHTHEDPDTVNAEEPIPLMSSRTLAYKTNHQNCTIWIGRTILAKAMLYSIEPMNNRGVARSTGLVERNTYDPWRQKADTQTA